MEIFSAAVSGLAAWESDGLSLDDVLDFRAPAKIRRSISSILFAFFRNKAAIEALIAAHSRENKPSVARVLKVALAEMQFQTGLPRELAASIAVDYAKAKFGVRPAGFINAVLRRAGTLEMDKFLAGQAEHVHLNLPRALYEKWRSAHGAEKLCALASALRKEAALSFRFTGETCATEELLAKIESKELVLPEWAGGYRFFSTARFELLAESGLLKESGIYIQDPSTVLAPSLLPLSGHERVLDLCAAPGGKAGLLAERLPKGFLVAGDRSWQRQRRTSENLLRFSGRTAVLVSSALEPAYCPGSFDAVLLDVPCSNTGVARRRPDALWRYTESRQAELAALQKKMLEQAAPLLRPGGSLVYSTCSIEEEENAAQVRAFLESHRDFSLLREERILPSAFHDGAYAALLMLSAE